MQICAAPPFDSDRASTADTRWRPHDLLRLGRLPRFDGEPDWLRAAFERAPTVSASSDLDLLIRTPEKLSRDAAAHLLDRLQALAHQAGIRVDAQLETPAGGVALVEWAAGKIRVMARHARGPQLIADPWAPAHGYL